MFKFCVIVLVLFVSKKTEAQNETNTTPKPLETTLGNVENTTVISNGTTKEDEKNKTETTENVPKDVEITTTGPTNTTNITTTVADNVVTTTKNIDNLTETTPIPQKFTSLEGGNLKEALTTIKPKNHGKHIVFVNGGSCKLAKAITNFGIIFLNNMNEENAVFSPLMIANSLAVLQQGSYGDTESQISSALNMSARESSINFQWMLEKINDDINISENIMKIASGLFISKDGSDVNPIYKDNVKNFFDSDVKITNFSNSSELINDWVRNKTSGRIKEVVEAGELDDYDELVLFSAAYFKGIWKLPTESDTNILKPFFYKNRNRRVPFMRTKGYFRYGTDYSIASKVVVMPDEEFRNALTIILPNKGVGLNAILSSLQTDHLIKYFSFPQKKIIIELPKLMLKSNFDVEPILSQFGVLDVFNDDSELSGIEEDSDRVLEATLFKHKAEFSIDYKKVKNSNVIKTNRIQEIFIADRPFLAILTDMDSYVPLFFAKVEKPCCKFYNLS